jgi:hypothetical protein
MKPILRSCCFLLLAPLIFAAPKQHVVTFGKWTTIKWLVGEDESTAINVKIRPLLVDGRIKEFAIGAAHDVTERTFVVQRMYRLNDSLEHDTGPTRWRWERGGWLLVDRVSGKVQVITLPTFDPYFSAVTWFRDYAAYCGLSEDGKKVFAMVLQLGKRKPFLKQPLGSSDADMPDSACPTPAWQRAPSRVTFSPNNEQKFTYTVRSRAVDLLAEDDESGED